ncbi:unnamed protein product [Scytosiphon promiscuus]
MPKHGLAPTRDKPSADPTVGGSVSPSTPVVLSNEVLLRSKIAQLQLEKAKQQRKPKTQSKSGVSSSSTPSPAASAAAAAGHSCSPHSSASGGNGNSDGNKRPSRPAPPVASKHQLADVEAAQRRPRGSTAAACGGASRGGTGARAESEEDAIRRFEQQVALAREDADLEGDVLEESPTNSGQQQQQRQRLRCGFTPKGVQALREIYREQVRAARAMKKHADVLTRKTQDIEKSNEVTLAKSDACAHEAVRLEQATAKLHALSGELEGRRNTMLETRKAEAAEEKSTREEMNASLNAVVSDISKKIKEQEEERIAQDAENASLRSDLQALLQEYDENKSTSEKAFRTYEEEGAKLAERLEGLTVASRASLDKEEGLKKTIEELFQAEGVLRKRVGEHSTRLQRQEAGLKTYLESVQRLQAEETKLLVSIARLSKEKSALLSRAGCVGVAGGGGGAGDVAGSDGGGGGGNDTGGGGDGGDGCRDKDEGGGGEGEGEVGEGKMRALLHEKEQRVADLEREKDRLQGRCRELQAERKRIMAEAESLAAAAAKKAEADIGLAADESDAC